MGNFIAGLGLSLLGLWLGVIAGEGSVRITSVQIGAAQELCAEREVDWIANNTVQCKDGSKYENYLKEK